MPYIMAVVALQFAKTTLRWVMRGSTVLALVLGPMLSVSISPPVRDPPYRLIVDGLLRSRVTGNVLDALLSRLQSEEKLLFLVISERILSQQSLLPLLISNPTNKSISNHLMNVVSIAKITLSSDLLQTRVVA